MFQALWFLLRYRIRFFQAASQQPLKLHLLKTEAYKPKPRPFKGYFQKMNPKNAP